MKKLLQFLGLGSKADASTKAAQAVASADPVQRLIDEGRAALRAGRREDARQKMEQALALQPDHAQALHHLGLLAAQDGDFARAAELIGRAESADPDDAELSSNLGNALRRLGRLDEALAAYDRAIATGQGYAYVYLNKARLCAQLQRLPAALASVQQFLERQPEHADAWLLHGDLLSSLLRYEEALASYSRAIALAPSSFVAVVNRGSTLEKLHRYHEACADFRRATEIEPNNFLAHFNLGATLLKALRIDEAIAALDEALRLKPDYALAYHCRANACDKQKRYREAIADYRKACELGSEVGSDEMLLFTQMKICDWQDFTALRQQILDDIAQGKEAGRPFLVLALSGELAIQRRIADILAANTRQKIPALPPLAAPPRHDKIRIAYFSADLRNHPVSYLTAEMFELHDRERFEITAFSFGPYDEMTQRINEVVDDYIDCRTLSDEDVVKLARTLEIDIAVDLGGYTENNRASLFALRVAPIQISYLGYPGTMGEGMHDYLLADAHLIPPELERWYAEKIVRLPVYQVNDTKRVIAERHFSRAELGLPEAGFVYCCFNNPIKYNPVMFDAWAGILRQVADSVLFLLVEHDDGRRNVRDEFARRGISAERIVFGDRLPRPEYLARYRACDLFLDTLPFNAGTTASDALWAGLPVLTCLGEAFASRMAGSLLAALKLPELITPSLDDYQRRAVELASHTSLLLELRARLQCSLREELLFDSLSVTRYIESAYATMYQRLLDALPPASFEVAA